MATLSHRRCARPSVAAPQQRSARHPPRQGRSCVEKRAIRRGIGRRRTGSSRRTFPNFDILTWELVASEIAALEEVSALGSLAIFRRKIGGKSRLGEER